MTRTPRRTWPHGFTLIELLVVILIIGIVSALALPTVLPALQHRQVSEAARILQSALVGARDLAIRSNKPCGVRLMPDPTLTQPLIGTANAGAMTLAYNRILPIETAPNYTDGLVVIEPAWTLLAPPLVPCLVLYQQQFDAVTGAPNAPTNWYWNIRVGDKVQIGGSGAKYTVVGPYFGLHATAISNPDRFVNIGAPGTTPPAVVGNGGGNPEFLYLVNGQDDDGNGYVDEGADGLDNDAQNGIDDVVVNATTARIGEWETEQWVGPELALSQLTIPQPQSYIITRRPVPTQGAREVALPQNVVIDATSWNAAQLLSANAAYLNYQPERSRLPVDPSSLQVDIMLTPSGTVIPQTVYSTPSAGDRPFFQLWLTERADVHEITALWGAPLLTPLVPNPNPNAGATPAQLYLLPMPPGVASYTKPLVLEGDRRLVTLFTRTGQVTTNTIETFSVSDLSAPFYQSQLGVREGP